LSSTQLTNGRFQLAEYVRNDFVATPEAGTSHEDLLKPEYWAHVAADLRPGCIIQAIPEDNTYFAEYFVIACARNWAKVSLLRFVELAEAKADIPEEKGAFEVNFGGPVQKWRFIRVADKQVIKSGFATKAEALKEMADYENALLA